MVSAGYADECEWTKLGDGPCRGPHPETGASVEVYAYTPCGYNSSLGPYESCLEHANLAGDASIGFMYKTDGQCRVLGDPDVLSQVDGGFGCNCGNLCNGSNTNLAYSITHVQNNANWDCYQIVPGSCESSDVPGCSDESACNFISDATEDDGSCEYNDECDVCGGDRKNTT